MKMRFQLGLRIFLQLSYLTGISHVKVRKDRSQWIKIFFSIYYYLVLVVTLSSFIITAFGNIFTYRCFVLENSFLLVLSTFASVGGLLTWFIGACFISLYAHIYIKDFVLSIKCLRICVKKLSMSKNESYVYFLIFVLYGCYNMGILLDFHVDNAFKTLTGTTSFITNLFSNLVALNFFFIFYHVILQLSMTFVSLKKIITNQLQHYEAYLFNNQVTTCVNEEKFSIKLTKTVLYLQKTTKQLFKFFELPVSLTFIIITFYIICEVTRAGTASSSRTTQDKFSFDLKRFPSLVNVSTLLFLTIWIPGTISKMIEEVLDDLYRLAVMNISFKKKKQIYGICKILEKFPKISFFGFFNIGRHCLIPIIGSIFTYLIVGLQFSQATSQQQQQ